MSQKILRIIHIEDERDARKLFQGIIEKFFPKKTELVSAETYIEGKELLEKEDFDLIFLDIQLRNRNGMDLLDDFPYIAPKTILCTANVSRGVEALNKGIFYYLVKPINVQEVIDVMNKFIEKREKDTQEELTNSNVSFLEGKLVIHDTKGFEIICIDDIIRLEAAINYTKILLQSGEVILATKNLKTFESQLDRKSFIRVHRSHLVNATFIKRINKGEIGGSIELLNGEEIKVSESGRNELKERFPFWSGGNN